MKMNALQFTIIFMVFCLIRASALVSFLLQYLFIYDVPVIKVEKTKRVKQNGEF